MRRRIDASEPGWAAVAEAADRSARSMSPARSAQRTRSASTSSHRSSSANRRTRSRGGRRTLRAPVRARARRTATSCSAAPPGSSSAMRSASSRPSRARWTSTSPWRSRKRYPLDDLESLARGVEVTAYPRDMALECLAELASAGRRARPHRPGRWRNRGAIERREQCQGRPAFHAGYVDVVIVDGGARAGPTR